MIALQNWPGAEIIWPLGGSKKRKVLVGFWTNKLPGFNYMILSEVGEQSLMRVESQPASTAVHWLDRMPKY